MTAKYVTVTELAQRWRVSNMSIYRLINARNLEVLRVGRTFRISEDSIDAYEAANLMPRIDQE